MLSWIRVSVDKSSPRKLSESFAAALLYYLTMAFPSWAGALLALYSISVCRSNTLKMRLHREEDIFEEAMRPEDLV
jgi:hypothetical protein